jgi:hypothetical protein
MWLNSEKGNSSTWKELTGVKQVLLSVFHIFQYTGNQKYRWYKQAISAMPINCKGINASGIHIPKSGIKYNQFIIVIRGEPINLVWPPKGFNKFKYNIRYTPVVMITNYTKIISSIVL